MPPAALSTAQQPHRSNRWHFNSGTNFLYCAKETNGDVMNAKLNDLSDLGKIFGHGDDSGEDAASRDSSSGGKERSGGKQRPGGKDHAKEKQRSGGKDRSRGGSGGSAASGAQDHAKSMAKLHVQLEKKGRKGKGVTVVKGFFHTRQDLQDFARELKARCGAGGTVKEDTIEIQGDHRKTAADFFRDRGFRVTGA